MFVARTRDILQNKHMDHTSLSVGILWLQIKRKRDIRKHLRVVGGGGGWRWVVWRGCRRGRIGGIDDLDGVERDEINQLVAGGAPAMDEGGFLAFTAVEAVECELGALRTRAGFCGVGHIRLLE